MHLALLLLVACSDGDGSLLSGEGMPAVGTGGKLPIAIATGGEAAFTPPASDAASMALSTPPARDGNRARLLINGEASLIARLDLIAQAEESIYLQALIFKADSSGRALADAMIARKQEKPALDIRVIVDAYANIQDVQAQLMYFELQNAGISVQGFEAFYLHWFNELNAKDWLAGNKRFHEKYLVADGTRAVIGGMNIGDEYFRCTGDPVLTWRDQDVLVEGPVAADVSAAFVNNDDWFTGVKANKPDVLNPDKYWEQWQKRHPAVDKVMDVALDAQREADATIRGVDLDKVCTGTPVPSAQHTDVRARFVRARPRAGETHIHDLYLSEIQRAERSVIIQNAYFVPTADLQAALVGAAKRGVEVTVITNSKATNDIPIITTAGRARYLGLIDAGVAVYEWHAERMGEGTVHSKIATFDDTTAIIGSHNLDPRSQGLNSEDVVLFEDARLSAELATWVRAQDLPMAIRVSRDQAVEWADPASLPPPQEKAYPWTDPRFDPGAFEYWLLRQIEINL